MSRKVKIKQRYCQFTVLGVVMLVLIILFVVAAYTQSLISAIVFGILMFIDQILIKNTVDDIIEMKIEQYKEDRK